MLRDRLLLRRREIGAVETRLAVDVRGDELFAHERPVRACGDRDVAVAGELEHADRIRGRLVERLVAGHRRDAEKLHLGRGEREQQGDRVVVPGVAVDEDGSRAHARSIASTSSAVGSDGCAPNWDAAIAPAAHARRSASSGSRPSRSETTRQAVNASPAAVPSIATTRRWPRARDLLSALEQHGALLAHRHGNQRLLADDLGLVAVGDDQVGADDERPCGRCVHAQPLRLRSRFLDRFVRNLQLAEDVSCRP